MHRLCEPTWGASGDRALPLAARTCRPIIARTEEGAAAAPTTASAPWRQRSLRRRRRLTCAPCSKPLRPTLRCRLRTSRRDSSCRRASTAFRSRPCGSVPTRRSLSCRRAMVSASPSCRVSGGPPHEHVSACGKHSCASARPLARAWARVGRLAAACAGRAFGCQIARSCAHDRPCCARWEGLSPRVAALHTLGIGIERARRELAVAPDPRLTG